MGAVAAAASQPQHHSQQNQRHQQHKQGQTRQQRRVIPAAVSLAWLRAAAAALALMPPSLCAPHHTLIACVDAHCEAAVCATLPRQPAVSPVVNSAGVGAAGAAAITTNAAATGTTASTAPAAAAAAGPPTDFQDPQRSVLLLEASRLWLGPAAVCHACAQIAAARSPPTSHPHSNTTATATPSTATSTSIADAREECGNRTSSNSNLSSAAYCTADILQATLLPRLQTCVASSAYEVRAACKALTHVWMGPLLER